MRKKKGGWGWVKRQSSDQLLVKLNNVSQCIIDNIWSSLQLEGQQTSVSINGSFLLENCSPSTNKIKTMDSSPQIHISGVDSLHGLFHPWISYIPAYEPCSKTSTTCMSSLKNNQLSHVKIFSWSFPLGNCWESVNLPLKSYDNTASRPFG